MINRERPVPSSSAPRRPSRPASLVLIAVGLLVPALSLIPLGSIWLWQKGYLLYWAAFALAVAVAVYALERWLLRPAAVSEADAAPPPPDETEAQTLAREFAWSPAEEQAWRDVKVLARHRDPAAIATQEGLMTLARETIETVASRMHPDDTQPLWQFTMPEALAIIERVSRRLRTMIVEQVPFGDRLTVAQALAIYRWRGTIDAAERAYDVWRIIRLANPATAATSEMREQLSKAMMQWGRDAVARRLMEAYVEEIGRAAIDLYGGRLRVASDLLASHVSAETAADRSALAAARSEPLRILVAGQTGAGKSSLVNALAHEVKAATDRLPATAAFTPYALEREGFPSALLIDSPGLKSDPAARTALIDKAADSDLVLWVAGANRADRAPDRDMLDAVRRQFATRLDRRRPPILLVLTHIDLLRPFGEWNPPYGSPTDDGREKARSITAATTAAAHDLGFADEDVIPVSLLDPAAPVNVERLWERIAEVLPEAMRAQLLRCLRDLGGSWSWRSLWSQAGGAGRIIAGAFRNRESTESRTKPTGKGENHGADH